MKARIAGWILAILVLPFLFLAVIGRLIRR